METNIEKLRADMRWEARKYAVSMALAAAALVGAGIAIGNFFTARQPAPAPIVIQLQAPASAPAR